MTSIKPFSIVPMGPQFPAGRQDLFAVSQGMQVTVVVRDSGVKILNGMQDVTAWFPYLAKQLKGLHNQFCYTQTSGLTMAQYKTYDYGAVLMGQLERRQLLTNREPDTLRPAGPDDFALCVYTAIPVTAYQHGADTLGHAIRYAHLQRLLAKSRDSFDGAPPYLRPMERISFNPWFGSASSAIPTNEQLWGQAEYEMLTNGSRNILVFDPYMPWGISHPLCLQLDCEAVLNHLDDEDEEL